MRSASCVFLRSRSALRACDPMVRLNCQIRRAAIIAHPNVTTPRVGKCCANGYTKVRIVVADSFCGTLDTEALIIQAVNGSEMPNNKGSCPTVSINPRASTRMVTTTLPAAKAIRKGRPMVCCRTLISNPTARAASMMSVLDHVGRPKVRVGAAVLRGRDVLEVCWDTSANVT